MSILICSTPPLGRMLLPYLHSCRDGDGIFGSRDSSYCKPPSCCIMERRSVCSQGSCIDLRLSIVRCCIVLTSSEDLQAGNNLSAKLQAEQRVHNGQKA